MGCNCDHFLRLFVELDSLTTNCFAAGEGFFVFVWPIYGVLIGLFLEYFTILYIFPGAMHEACFVTGRLISLMACMIFLALINANLLRVGCKGGFSSLTFPTMNGTVGICAVGGFRSCSSL